MSSYLVVNEKSPQKTWFRIHLPEIEGRYQNVCIGVSIMITVSSVGAKQGTRLFPLEPPLVTWINLNPIMDK